MSEEATEGIRFSGDGGTACGELSRMGTGN